MSHYIGKIDLSSLIDVSIADVEMYGRTVKAVVIPMKDNDIVQYNGELQLWFRAFKYREPRGRFSHFLMKYIPMKDIKRMSASQIEKFANNSIGAMMKTDTKVNVTEEEEKGDYIKENL